MATKERELIYECDVKKLFLRDGEKRKLWVSTTVDKAIRDEATEFRCKECHGAVKVFKQRTPTSAAPHVEHAVREDAEYCPAGLLFQQNPGREPRLSATPIE